MKKELRERLERLIQQAGKSKRAVSLKAGMSPDVVRDMFRRPDLSPTVETVEKLASALDTTPEWLAFGVGEKSELKLYESPFVEVPLAGIVAAGVFRPVDEYTDDEPVRIYTLPDPEFPQSKLVAFQVEGDSMNAASPPIPDGSKVICLDYIATSISLHTGMKVVVERIRDGGHLREWSIKEVVQFDDRVELHPRSTNPKHKPIIVPKDENPNDGQEVRILAVVRKIEIDAF